MSGNTATGQGSVFNVGNVEMVSFTNVTFDDNSGILDTPSVLFRPHHLHLTLHMHSLHLTTCCLQERRGLATVPATLPSPTAPGLTIMRSWAVLSTPRKGAALQSQGPHSGATMLRCIESLVGRVNSTGPAAAVVTWVKQEIKCASLHWDVAADLPIWSMLQDYGGAVVVGNDVQASFESCDFLDNGRPLCAEQDFTLVCALTEPFNRSCRQQYCVFAHFSGRICGALMPATNAVSEVSASMRSHHCKQ